VPHDHSSVTDVENPLGNISEQRRICYIRIGDAVNTARLCRNGDTWIYQRGKPVLLRESPFFIEEEANKRYFDNLLQLGIQPCRL